MPPISGADQFDDASEPEKAWKASCALSNALCRSIHVSYISVMTLSCRTQVHKKLGDLMHDQKLPGRY
jgi:hypothetical protein